VEVNEHCGVMGYCVEWWYFVMVIVWRVVVFCYGYCVASGGILLWVIVWRVVVFCYGLLCGEWWYIVMGYCVASGGIFLPTFRNKLSVNLQKACFPEIYIRIYIQHVKCFSTPVHLILSES